MISNSHMLAVTVDIEDWYHLTPVTGLPSSKYVDVPHFFAEWKGRYDYLTEPTNTVLDLLDKIGVKATFFVVADVVEYYPGLVDKIAQRGHEIACHGLHHTCKINPRTKEQLMTVGEFRKRTQRAKQILEHVTGQPVIGYRAPNAYIGGWMIDVLEELGFEYDSSVSVNSFYNKTDSQLRCVETNPYYPKKGTLEPGETRAIIEIPWPSFRFGLKFPTGGGPLLRLFGASYIQKGLNMSLGRGHTVFYFHPVDISPERFPLHDSIVQRLFWAIRGTRVEQRIARVLEHTHVRMTTCKELVKAL